MGLGVGDLPLRLVSARRDLCRPGRSVARGVGSTTRAFSRTRRMAVCSVIVAAGLAACTPQLSARPPAPLPSGAAALLLETTPPATEYREGWACPAELINPVRLVSDGETVAFQYLDGRRVDLVWPRGFSARMLDGRTEIVAPDGSVIARDGDEISELVGDTREICEINGVTYPPAS